MTRITSMKATLISVLVLALLVMIDAKKINVAKCPKGHTGNETVQIAHETDCTKFYLCVGNTKIVRDCPVMDSHGNRLHFNPKLQVCDWPWEANCKKSLSSVIKISPLAAEQPIPTKCPLVDPQNYTVHLAHERDCTKFYKCSYGKKYPMTCPKDEDGNRLHFNPRSQVCDWPWNVNCTLPLPTVLLRSLAPKDDYPTKCPLVDSVNETIQLPHESDCTKYYMCAGGRKILMVCPLFNDEGDRLYFNKEIHGCDWPWNVDCKMSRSGWMPRITLKNGIPSKQCPLHDSKDRTVHIPHEYDCTKFYKCSYGKKYEMDCPKTDDSTRLHYNKTVEVCDWPWNVDCDAPDPVPTTLATDPTTPLTDPTTRPTDPTTRPTDPTTRPTDPTTRPTDPTTRPTDPTTRPTDPTTTTELTPSSTTPSSGIDGCLRTCPNNDPPNKITALPHADCRKWCRCQNNEAKVHTCPLDYHFSPTLKTCTSPDLAGCKGGKNDKSGATNPHDEALMNVLGYNHRFMW